MSGFLFDRIIFGPVHSRRMGLSLGVNLLPLDTKCCTFNCVYCECGWTGTHNPPAGKIPTTGEVAGALERRLITINAKHQPVPDAITFAGNGEPTLHPEFGAIVAETVRLRDKFLPSARISVLSNGSRLHVPSVFNSLFKVDLNIQKLDAGYEDTIRLINQPRISFNLEDHVSRLASFHGMVIIQSLFLRGEYNGKIIDNTTDDEIEAWTGHLKAIKPRYVMIYPIDRATPTSGIEKLSVSELDLIAARVNREGISTRVYP